MRLYIYTCNYSGTVAKTEPCVNEACLIIKTWINLKVAFRHNDLAWRYRHYAQNKVYGQYDLRTDLTEVWTDKDDPTHTDIPRLRKGKVGAQVINID